MYRDMFSCPVCGHILELTVEKFVVAAPERIPGTSRAVPDRVLHPSVGPRPHDNGRVKYHRTTLTPELIEQILDWYDRHPSHTNTAIAKHFHNKPSDTTIGRIIAEHRPPA